MSSLQEEQKLDRNHLRRGDERDEMEGSLQRGTEDGNGPCRSSLESDDSRRVATPPRPSDPVGGPHPESLRPPLVARRCSANFNDSLLPTSPRKSAHQRRIERSSMAQHSPDRRDEHQNSSRPPLPREMRATMKAFPPPQAVDEERPYEPEGGTDREGQREGMENAGSARLPAEEVPTAPNASNVTIGRRVHHMSSTHRVMKSDGVTSVSDVSGTHYNSEPRVFSELHVEERTYTVRERIPQDRATTPKMEISESTKEPKDEGHVGDTAETGSAAMSDSQKKSKKSSSKKKKKKKKSDGSSKDKKRSEKKKKRNKSKKSKKERPSPEKVWFGSRKGMDGDLAGRHNECPSVNNGGSDLSSMTDTAQSQATPGNKKSRRADISSTIRVPIVLEKPDDDVSYATDPSNKVRCATAMKVQNDNGDDVVFLSEEALATSRASAAATAAASLLMTEEEGSYDTAAKTVSTILSRSSRLKEDADKDEKRISDMESIEEENKLALVVIPSAGYSSSISVKVGEESEVETQHRAANGASGTGEEEDECKQTPLEKVMEGIEEENELGLVAIPSGGRSSAKSVTLGESSESETQQQETNMPINPLREDGRKPIPFVKVQNAMRDYLTEQREAAEKERRDGDDAIGTATHQRTPTEMDTFWAKCAILAASAVLKSRGGTVQIAQVAAETILVACSNKDTGILKGDTAGITDIAAQTSLNILSAGGSEAAASAAAIAVLNEEKNRIQHDLDCRSEEPEEPSSPTEVTMNNDAPSVASRRFDRTTSNEQLMPDRKSSHIQDSPVVSGKSVEKEERTNKRSASVTSDDPKVQRSTVSHDQDSLDEFLKQNAETDDSTHRSEAPSTKESTINASEIQSGSAADSNPNGRVAVEADPYEAVAQMSEGKVAKKLAEASSVSHHGPTPRTSNAPQVLMESDPSFSKKEIVEEGNFSTSTKLICENPGGIAALESESAKAKEVLDETMCQNSRTKSISEEPMVKAAVASKSVVAREVLDETKCQNSRTKPIIEEPRVIAAVSNEASKEGGVLGETKCQKSATKSIGEEPGVIAAAESESAKAVSIVEVNLPNTSAACGIVMAADSSLTLTKDDDLTTDRSDEMKDDIPMNTKERESGKLGWLQALEKRKAEIKAERLSRNTANTLERDLLVKKIRRIKCRAAKIPYEGEEARNNADVIGRPGLISSNTGDIYGVIECDKEEKTIEAVGAINQENLRVESQLEKDPIGADSDISASATNECSQSNKGGEGAGEEGKSLSLESEGVVMSHPPAPNSQDTANSNDIKSSIKIPCEDTEVVATRFQSNEPELSEEVEVFLEEDFFQEKDGSSDMYASIESSVEEEEEEEASGKRDSNSKMDVSAQSGFKEEEEVFREEDSSSEEEELSKEKCSSSKSDISAQQSAKDGGEGEAFREEDSSSKINVSKKSHVKETEFQIGLETQNFPQAYDEFLESRPDVPEGEKRKKRRKSVFKRASHSFKKLVGKKGVQEREYGTVQEREYGTVQEREYSA